jgi:sterol desaturase/sphingolipid hydroxylase (fatty acid hydroxylase superfamily)
MAINLDFLYLFDSHQRIYWVYLLAALSIALIYSKLKPETKYFTKAIWWHPSAQLDYKYFILSLFIKVLIISPLLISVNEVAFFVVKFLEQNLVYHDRLLLNKTTIMISFTVILFLLNDMTRYWLHRLMHSSDILWRFHKIHHSAEVLTPLTFYRVHPVENILFGLRYAFTAGVVSGVFVYYFGAKVSVYEVMGVNVFLLFFSLIGSNLRHSHIHLSYGKFLEHIIVSPAQHQLHHSVNSMNKNYGSSLAIWDYMGNSLKCYTFEKKMKYGLGTTEEKVSHSLSALLFHPFNQK